MEKLRYFFLKVKQIVAEPEFESSVPNPPVTLNNIEINVKRPAFLFCFHSALTSCGPLSTVEFFY